jgi:hypothetical protein
MMDDFKSKAPSSGQSGLARRNLFRRLALMGVGGAAVAAGMTVESASHAQAQGYPPLPPPRYERVPPPPG